MQIKDYDNPVATAVRKIGGVKKAAKMLLRDAETIEIWIRNGYVPDHLSAEILNEYSDVPEEDLLRRGEEYNAKLSAWLAQLSA